MAILVSANILFAKVNPDSLFKSILPNSADDRTKLKIVKLKLEQNNWDNYEIQGLLSQKQLELALEIDDKKETAEAYKNVGSVAFRELRYSDAINALNSGYRVATEIKDYEMVVHCLNYLSMISEQFDDVHKALDYCLRAYSIADKCKDTYPKAATANILARRYHFLKEYQKSLAYADTAMLLYAKSKEKQEKLNFGYATLYRVKSFVYTKLNRFDSAFIYINKAFDKYPQYTNLAMPIAMHYGLIYNKMGRFDSALVNLNKVPNQADDVINWEINLEKYKAFKGLGRIDSALRYLEIQDSLTTKIRENDASKLTARLELKRAEDEYNSRIRTEEQARTYTLIIAILIVLFISGIAYFIYSKYKTIHSLNAKLDKANSTKDRLFSIISHDLMNPVASQKQMLDLINSRYDRMNEADRIKYFKNMQSSGNRLFMMMDNLLNWSRLNLGALAIYPTDVDLNELISEEVEFQSNTIVAKELTIETQMNIIGSIKADENIIRVIIRNLLANAIKFSEPKGIINLSADNSNGAMRIKVINSGNIISDEIIEQINSGEIVKSNAGTNNEKGTGLGLSICKELTELHGGKLILNNSDATEITVEIKQ